jgi:hypothetical protein
MIDFWLNGYEKLSTRWIPCGADCCIQNTCITKISSPLRVRGVLKFGKGCIGSNIYLSGGCAQSGLWKSNKVLDGCVAWRCSTESEVR